MSHARYGWRSPLPALSATLLAVATMMTLGSGRAEAYARYLTDDGQPFHWNQTCVPITAYPNNLADMTPAEVELAATAAARVWSSEALPCTYMSLQVVMSSLPTVRAKLDYRNSLVFRRDTWCKEGDAPGNCSYDPSALAITSVFVATKTGLIRDADIEVNAKYFVWANLSTSQIDAGIDDLQNTLAHEMGHLIGLDHTCYIQGAGRQPWPDHNGELVPECGMASSAIHATTMFARAMHGDISMRTLDPDDEEAVCDIYPVAMDPQVCPTVNSPLPEEGCACAAAPVRNQGSWLILGFAVAATWARRRRRGSSRQCD